MSTQDFIKKPFRTFISSPRVPRFCQYKLLSGTSIVYTSTSILYTRPISYAIAGRLISALYNRPSPPGQVYAHQMFTVPSGLSNRSSYWFIKQLTVVASSDSTLAHLRPWTPSFEWLHTVRGLGKQILQLKECSGRPSLPP